MDARQITVFFAVVQHRSLSAAAQALRLSQPTLTRQIQSFESEFGAPLFVRGGRGMTLTDAGTKLFEGLKGLDRQIQALRNDVAATVAEPIGEVAFGIPPSPRALVCIPLLERFAKQYPRTSVRVSEETSGTLRDLVASGVLDVAITNSFEPQDGLESEKLGHEPVMLVGHRQSDLSERHEISLAEIGNKPLILTTRPNSLRIVVESGLNQSGFKPNIKFEANTLPLMTDLVRAGLGYTVLPACGVQHLLKDQLVTASPIKNLQITWLAARPKKRVLSIAADRFYACLRDVGAELVRSRIWLPPTASGSSTARRSYRARRARRAS
jgi:LysR family nitrogen assimilation transcriptional regulator